MSPSFRSRLLSAALLCTFAASAQTPAPAQPEAKEPDYVTTRDFKAKLFEVRYRTPSQLREVLRPLTSGAKGVAFEATDRDGLKFLSVRDYPENLAAIEEALKRVDVPPPPMREVELHIHVLFASRQEGPVEAFPAELRDVLAALKGTLNYRTYTPAITFVQRVEAGSNHMEGKGTVDVERTTKSGTTTNGVDFKWRIKALELTVPEGAPASFALKQFTLETFNAGVETDLTLKDGEKVVVGTSALKDKGLIVVVTAKLL